MALALLCAGVSQSVDAADLPAADRVVRALTPSQIEVEHGGYVGLIAVGGQWQPSRVYRTGLQVGIVPRWAGGLEVWHFVSRHELRLVPPVKIWRKDSKSRLDLTLPLVGVSAIFSPSARLWIALPRRYPSWNYYPWPTALRLAPWLGAELTLGRHALFARWICLEVQLAHYVSNRRHLSVDDLGRLGTLGVGYRLTLE